jgi:hypothetical protein
VLALGKWAWIMPSSEFQKLLDSFEHPEPTPEASLEAIIAAQRQRADDCSAPT